MRLFFALTRIRGGLLYMSLFRNPLTFFKILQTNRWPSGKELVLKSGVVLRSSSDSFDIASVYEIFAKREYGHIPAGAIVIDLGANVGFFSLYAAQEQASRVLAFEPSKESFDTLSDNVAVNKLETKIKCFQLAVSGKATGSVKFPVASSRNNSIIHGDSEKEFTLVSTTDLATILDENNIAQVDLLKIDVEGAEEDILLNTPDSVWGRIKRIRMEYHRGLQEVLRPFLESKGFRLVKAKPTNDVMGMLWFERN
jgi:FkbM family methyltransferase